MSKIRALVLGTLARLLEHGEPDPQVWLFSSAENRCYNYNSRYFFEYVLDNCPDIHPVYILNDDQRRAQLAGKVGDYHVGETRTLAGMRRALRAGVWFTSAGLPVYSPFLKNRIRIINLWHGIPLKKIVLEDPQLGKLSRLYFRKIFSDNYTWVLTTSEELVPLMAKSFGVDENIVRVLGQPRTDRLLKAARGPEPACGCENKAPGSPCRRILYAPTYRDEEPTRLFPFEDYDRDLLDAFLEQENAVISLHLHIQENTDPGPFLSDRVCLYSGTGDKVGKKTFSEDITGVLPEFDLLITDYSSIYLDYLLLDRPIVFLPYDQKQYLEKRGLNFAYEEVTPGPKPETMKDFMKELRKALHGEDRFAEERIRIKRRFHGTPEASCPKICQEVRKLFLSKASKSAN